MSHYEKSVTEMPILCPMGTALWACDNVDCKLKDVVQEGQAPAGKRLPCKKCKRTDMRLLSGKEGRLFPKGSIYVFDINNNR